MKKEQPKKEQPKKVSLRLEYALPACTMTGLHSALCGLVDFATGDQGLVHAEEGPFVPSSDPWGSCFLWHSQGIIWVWLLVQCSVRSSDVMTHPAHQ